jgi:polysaccharide pyruvyl transferase WcaK-like protein
MKFVSPRVVRGNRGDLLSRWGILCAVSELDTNPIDVFCSRTVHLPPGIANPTDYGPIYNLVPPFKGWLSLIRAKVALWTGGLDLQDDSSLAKLMHTWLVFSIYNLLGLKIVCVCQGAGPLDSRAGKFLARAVLNRVAVFMARDQGTFNLVASLNSRTRLIRAHDGIFLPGFENAGVRARMSAELQNEFAPEIDGPLIAINVRMWFHFTGGLLPYHYAQSAFRNRALERMADFERAMARLVVRLRKELNARVVLVSMYEPGVEEWEDDALWLASLKSHFADDSGVVHCEKDLTIPEFFAMMSCFDLVIGTRLHSTLSALRGGVKAIHLAYTLKGRDIFASLGLDEFAVDLERFMESPDPVFELARTTLERQDLNDRIREIGQRVVGENRQALREALASVGALNQKN